jgi:hypothetical protein
MKKILSLVVLLVISVALFADGYIVKSVSGTVTYEVTPGVHSAIVVGQEIQMSTRVKTGLNSTLVLESEGKTSTIGSMRVGTISSLIGESSVVKIGGRVQTSQTESSSRQTSNVSTASTRASDAQSDLEWAED